MPSATDRAEFAPPQQPGMLRAFGLAIVAHVLLMLALTWGINWKRESQTLSAEAELWSAVPQQAAPRPVEATPPPAPAPPEPKVAPPPPPVAREADIALERERKKQVEARHQEELDRQKKLAEKKRQDELKKQELAQKAADEKKKADAAKAAQQARAEEQKKADEKRRQEHLERMKNLAKGSGSPTAAGTAERASGPSDSYAGRIRARVKPNIVFTDDASGNPTAEVEVRMAPDGTITGKRVVKPSGVRAWDEAVLRALDKTEVLPRDLDGRVHSPLVIVFRQRD